MPSQRSWPRLQTIYSEGPYPQISPRVKSFNRDPQIPTVIIFWVKLRSSEPKLQTMVRTISTQSPEESREVLERDFPSGLGPDPSFGPTPGSNTLSWWIPQRHVALCLTRAGAGPAGVITDPRTTIVQRKRAQARHCTLPSRNKTPGHQSEATAWLGPRPRCQASEATPCLLARVGPVR
jgi:hypothetical protein